MASLLQLFSAKAQLSAGEVKSSSSGFGDGVMQLVRRLALMHWAVKQLRPAIKEFFKVGRNIIYFINPSQSH